ncbi:family 78 glycoside hydrolase catalytic domain [Bifidobacterium saguini]|uniref:alpha-L-rhamnosidase n=2 Tax=Bifidobacterium saguini TaxID=762210 RepID=A0ABX7SC86_9BIFI|nr:family 78 glycoside hydrolase catalytic domain [Bifidobacterium saguini]
MKSVASLQIEHYAGPAMGIGTFTPRISWTYDARVDIAQDANVLIRVRRRLPGHDEHTEQVIASASDNVLRDWPFRPLGKREQAYVSVALANDCDEPIWSDEAYVEPGLIHSGDILSQMVGPAWREPWSDRRQAPLIRTELQLRDTPQCARLYVSAFGLVDAEINGNPVGEDILNPGWTLYNERLQYRTYDVTDLLHAGNNAMGFWLGDGWYRGRLGFWGGKPNVYGSKLGVWAQLEVTFADGSTQMVASNAYDGAWKAAKGPIISSGLCEGETYDARLLPEGWSCASFDDSGWERVTEIDFDPLTLTSPEHDPIRRIGSHDIVSMNTLDDGSVIIDFGQNCTQRLEFNVSTLPAGTTITVQHAEVLDNDGDLFTRPLRRGIQRDTYISDGKNKTWEPRFTIHGFRYAKVQGWLGTLRPEDIVCHVYGSVMRRIGWFDCSSEIVNAMHSNVVWSMLSNFVSVPTDCPQRDERMGWTGDIALFAPTASFLYDTEAFLSNWLVDVASETDKYNAVPYYVPFIPLAEWRKPENIAIWGDAAVLVPWALYMASGDVHMLKRQYALSRMYIEQVSELLSEDGVWDRPPKLEFGQLGDWLDPTAPPEDAAKAMTAKELVATAFYAQSVTIAKHMAEILGNDGDKSDFEALEHRVRTGFQRRFIKADGRMTSDTQCAYALAIQFKLISDDEGLSVAGNRLAALVRAGDYTVGTGFAGTPYILPALTATGHLDEAYRLFLSTKCPSWLYQVSMGATTTWERWDSQRPDGSFNPGGMTSFNHYSLGSVATWMHETIGGISPLAPGWKEFLVSPMLGGAIDHAHVRHNSPYGVIDCAWQVQDDSLKVTLTVPHGARALVKVCGHEEWAESGVYARTYGMVTE